MAPLLRSLFLISAMHTLSASAAAVAATSATVSSTFPAASTVSATVFPPLPVTSALVCSRNVTPSNANTKGIADLNQKNLNSTVNGPPLVPSCNMVKGVKPYLQCQACFGAADAALGVATFACAGDSSACAAVGPEGYVACVAGCIAIADYSWYTALQKCVCLHIDCSDKKLTVTPNSVAGLYVANTLYGLEAVPFANPAQLGGNVTIANLQSGLTTCNRLRGLGGTKAPTSGYGFVTGSFASA